MGLDMYLNKKYYIGESHAMNKITGKIDIKVDGKKFPVSFDSVIEITQRQAYWRKANAIHKWFVDNVQDGKDDCREYEVTQEQLIELRELCEHLLETRSTKEAMEELPPQEGFFFGGKEIDEYYWEDLKDTVEQLEGIENTKSDGSFPWVYFTYRSSW